MRLGNDRHTCISLNEQEVRPSTEEINFAGETRLAGFGHLGTLLLNILKKIIHPVYPFVSTVPDIEDCRTGVVGLTAFFDVHDIVGIHESGRDVTG